ncbi:MAG: CutA1 divalent ion tolerance protein, partial [Gammaproteobacteria bacterium]|nr:CutA1 divalent ion tolerance protein [Gammaproteobacteria bacterium]
MQLETLPEKNLVAVMEHKIAYLMVFSTVPEIIALPITHGTQNYLDWLNNTVKKA